MSSSATENTIEIEADMELKVFPEGKRRRGKEAIQ